MINKSKKHKTHLAIIVVIVGLLTAALIFNYYRLNSQSTRIAFRDGISGRLITVQHLPNGLAKFSINHDSKIVPGSGAIIESSIGTDAANNITNN